jgi:cytochrome P450
MKTKESHKNTPTKSKGHWLLGDLRELIQGPLKYVIKHQAKYGDLFEVDSLSHKVMFASHPDIAKHLLVDNNKAYFKSFDYEILKLVLGEGLISSDGNFWLKQRRLAQPAFHKKRLDMMFDIMRSETLQFCERLDPYQQNGSTFNINVELTKVTIDIVAKTLFGTEVDTSIVLIGKHITDLNAYISAKVNNPLLPPLWVPTKRNFAFKKAMNDLNKIIYQIIEKRRQNPEDKDDLLAMLMNARDEETGEGMTDLQLRDEILTLFVAGHETSATSLSWILILLSKHPEWMQKCKQEIDSVLGNRLPELEDMMQMPTLKRVIEEAMRLYPPAWIVGRKALEKDQLLGYEIKKGTNVIVCVYKIHRHPDFWENPDDFDPDRFLPERSANRHKYAYFPFGGGPRMCIGNNFAIMEMTLILSMMLQRYTPIATQNHYEWESLVTLRPKGEVSFRLLPK